LGKRGAVFYRHREHLLFNQWGKDARTPRSGREGTPLHAPPISNTKQRASNPIGTEESPGYRIRRKGPGKTIGKVKIKPDLKLVRMGKKWRRNSSKGDRRKSHVRKLKRFEGDQVQSKREANLVLALGDRKKTGTHPAPQLKKPLKKTGRKRKKEQLKTGALSRKKKNNRRRLKRKHSYDVWVGSAQRDRQGREKGVRPSVALCKAYKQRDRAPWKLGEADSVSFRLLMDLAI